MSVESIGGTCARCAADVPRDARFCMSCGAPVATTDEADSTLQARLAGSAPAPLVAKMRAARISGERKPVTALFADIVGSTSLAEQMDPEDWTQMINGAFDLMSQAVFRYEGTIAQLQGDAMLAFFGAPVAHEDDPDRAVLAALDMVASIDELARQLRAVHGIDFRIRAGINTGPVVVGNVGTDLRYEYTALGDAMNVAARMQAAADPGEVLITDATRRLLGDAFELGDLGPIAVKGKAEPVHAYRVDGRRASPARRRGLERIGLDSPMVGREAQLAQLRTLWEVARAGRGRICFVMGEPGIGKSRLLSELQRALATETLAVDSSRPLGWYEGRCVSYGQSLPYHLLLDLVRNLLELPWSESGSVTRKLLDERLAALPGEETPDVAPFLAHLLGLPTYGAETDHVRLEPTHLQERYAASVHRVLRAMTSEGPLVVVCEDVHWADPTSAAVLESLLPLAARLPVLVIAALRPDTDAPGWQLVSSARAQFGQALTEIVLEQLSEADSRELVSNLLVIESLPDEVRDAILARADGNPFFVEEVVRMLIDGRMIERRGDHWVATDAIARVEIPATLHGLLLARIDQLPEAAKRSLRIASVIGRQFPVRVLEDVLTQTSEVR
jgi:class 3 adenylate cyclase